MTEQDLIRAGFKEFVFSKVLHPYADKMFQKRYFDEKGIKYFITVSQFDFSKVVGYKGETFRYTFENQFILPDGERINVESVFSNDSIQMAEEKFEEIWTKLNCQYYEYNY